MPPPVTHAPNAQKEVFVRHSSSKAVLCLCLQNKDCASRRMNHRFEKIKQERDGKELKRYEVVTNARGL